MISGDVFYLFDTMSIAFVTGNDGKFSQVDKVLSPEMHLTQAPRELIEPQSNDMLAVSGYKVKQAYTELQKPVLVDDSGIYFDAYPNFPGVFSKYIFESLGISGLQNLFSNQSNHHAWYQCILSYMDETLTEPIQFVGTSAGVIDFSFIDHVVVNPHLPFDAFFRPEGMDCVAAMDMHTFARQHHRVRAAQQLKERFLK